MRLPILFIPLFITAGVLSGCGEQERNELETQYLKAKYASLNIQESLLKQYGGTETADIVVGVSNQGLERALNLLSGTKIFPNPAPENFEDVHLEINSVELSSLLGHSDLKLKASLKSPSKKVEVNVTFSGILLLDQPDARPIADSRNKSLNFRIKIREIDPTLSWSFFRYRAHSKLRELLTAKLATDLESKLKVSLPIANIVAPELKIAGQHDYVDNESNSSIALRYSNTSFTPVFETNIHQFVFHESGLWLFGRADSSVVTIENPPEIDDSLLTQEISNSKNRLKVATKHLNFDSGNSFFMLRNSSLAVAESTFNSLPKNTRTVKFESVGSTGKLFEKEWKDDILGKGGIFVELNGDNAISGQIIANSISLSADSESLKYSTRVTTNVSAKLHAHFDPLVGGGIGKRMTIDGRSSPEFSGEIYFSSVNRDGIVAAIGVNRLHCSKFEVSAKDRGDLKIGANVSQVIGGGKPTVFSMIDNIPQSIPSKNMFSGDDKFRIEHPSNYVEISYSPKTIRTSDNGIYIELDLMAKRTNAGGDDQGGIARQKLESLIQDLSNTSKAVTCGEPGAIEIVVLDIPFGENNELIKFVANLIDGVKKGAKDVENDLKRRERNLINPPKSSPMHKPLHKPVDTVKCVITLGGSC